MDGGSQHCMGASDKKHPQEKEMQNGKMVVWGGHTDNWEKKRRERQRRKGKIYPSECRVPKNSKERWESLPQWTMQRKKKPTEELMLLNWDDELVGWHHWPNGHEFEQAPGAGEGQRSLVCCSPWGREESDTTQCLNDDNHRKLGENPRTDLCWHLLREHSPAS